MKLESAQEALFVALEMERRALTIYQRALLLLEGQGRGSSPLYAAMLRMLEDERRHLKRFQKLYEGLDEPRERKLILSAVAGGLLFEGGLMEAAREGILQDVPSMLAYAIQEEEKAAHAYQDFARQCRDGETRAALEAIAREELQHRQELESKTGALLEEPPPDNASASAGLISKASLFRFSRPIGLQKPLKPLMLALGGLLAALVFIATVFLNLPVPMSQGYVHLGDGFILLGTALLSYAAIPAAALGSLLADLLLGFAPYALPTFFIKGGMAAIALLAAGAKPVWLRAVIWMMAEGFMAVGYFLAEWLVLGVGFGGAWANVPGNAIQGIGGVVVALALLPILRLANPD
ncbi:MAG: ECF transporter S component [Clostridia bacterium]|nr:ECF transporter S component [Clostridia bacterium]